MLLKVKQSLRYFIGSQVSLSTPRVQRKETL